MEQSNSDRTGFHEHLGRTLKLMRKATGKSQRDLGKLLGICQSSYSRLEQGDQSVSVWQLKMIADYFNIPVGSLYSGKINFWKLAETFNQPMILPKRYQSFHQGRVRSIVPLLNMFSTLNLNQDEILEKYSVDPLLLRNLNQPMGIRLTMDLFQELLSVGALDEAGFRLLGDQFCKDNVHDWLNMVYRSQKTQLHLISAYLDNLKHYDSHFDCEYAAAPGQRLAVTFTPQPHLAKLPAKEKRMLHLFCKYRKATLSRFPQYMSRPPAGVTESECFKDTGRACHYLVEAA